MLRIAAVTGVLAALTGCGGDGDDPSPTSVDTGSSVEATQPEGEGPRGHLTLTGGYTYDGPFMGMFQCYHDSTNYLTLDVEAPYHLSIIVNDVRDGTFTVAPQDRNTGFEEATPGEPVIDVRGLNGPGLDMLLWHDGGEITFVDGGTSGRLSSDWIDDVTGTTVHSEMTWEGCPLIL